MSKNSLDLEYMKDAIKVRTDVRVGAAEPLYGIKYVLYGIFGPLYGVPIDEAELD